MNFHVVAHYEHADAQPPGPILPDLTRVLGVSTDQLLGVEPVKAKIIPRTTRLLKLLREIEKLAAADQRATLRFVDALLETRGITQAS